MKNLDEVSLFFLATIFLRFGTFFFMAPILGEVSVPRTVRLGLAMICSVMMWSILPIPQEIYTSSWIVWSVREFFVAFCGGFVLRINMQLLVQMMQTATSSLGLNFSPFLTGESQGSLNPLGMLWSQILIQVLFLTNSHALIIRAFFNSFQTDIWVKGISNSHISNLLLWLPILLKQSLNLIWPFFCLQWVSALVFCLVGRLFPRIVLFPLNLPFNILLCLILYFSLTVSWFSPLQRIWLPQFIQSFETILRWR